MKYLDKKEVKGTPPYRYELRGKIAMAGYRTLGHFSQATRIDISKMSRVICGWEWPNKKMQAAIAERLKISVDELMRIL